MRIRVLRRFYYKTQGRVLDSGDVLNIPDEEARIWIHHGMAMEDKTIDVPEMKPVDPAEEVVEVEKPKPKKVK